MTKTIRPAEPASRRAVMRAGLGLIGTSVAVVAGAARARAQDAAAPAATKLEQSAVQYQNHPQDGKLCSICANFIAPNACTIVAGKIAPIGYCVAFAPKG